MNFCYFAPVALALATSLATTLAASPLGPQDEIQLKVPAARAILDAWQAENPEPAVRKLHIVLWTPSDRDPAPRYQERLSAILLHLRDYYAREMERLGFGPRTLRFDHIDDGLLRIHVVKGQAPYADYDGQSGGRIRTESLRTLRLAGIDPDRETLVIFCNMSNWDPEKRRITQNSPYYAGGTHMSGNAWQVDSPILDLDLLAKTEPRVSDGQYGDISIGRYNSIFIGGVCHELGHALGLPHNRERPDEREAFGTALMGSGNRTFGEELRNESKGSFLTLAHGLRLASHPMFSGSIKGASLRANAQPSELAIEPSDKGFTFSGKVTADPPVYGVVAYMDPEGGSDYDATTATAVPDAEGRFTLHCQALAAGKAAELRVVFLQANGVASGFLSNTPFRYPYRVNADGVADISAARTRLRLEPLVAAIHANDPEAAAAAAQSAAIQEDPALAGIAARLTATLAPRGFIEPGEAKSIPLGDLQPAVQEIGYGRPSIDRLPSAAVLLAAGGRIFSHGFYAHAPARHEWLLDGTWKSLEVHAGIADGNDGSVSFLIEADGKPLAQSPLIKRGGLHHFEVDLSGVRHLVLRVDDGGDGNRADWGLWLDPVLQR